jgi:hypothetical protein
MFARRALHARACGGDQAATQRRQRSGGNAAAATQRRHGGGRSKRTEKRHRPRCRRGTRQGYLVASAERFARGDSCGRGFPGKTEGRPAWMRVGHEPLGSPRAASMECGREYNHHIRMRATWLERSLLSASPQRSVRGGDAEACRSKWRLRPGDEDRGRVVIGGARRIRAEAFPGGSHRQGPAAKRPEEDRSWKCGGSNSPGRDRPGEAVRGASPTRR